MRIRATEGVAAAVRERGGRLYVWTSAHRCCTGPLVLLETGAEPPGRGAGLPRPRSRRLPGTLRSRRAAPAGRARARAPRQAPQGRRLLGRPGLGGVRAGGGRRPGAPRARGAGVAGAAGRDGRALPGRDGRGCADAGGVPAGGHARRGHAAQARAAPARRGRLNGVRRAAAAPAAVRRAHGSASLNARRQDQCAAGTRTSQCTLSRTVVLPGVRPPARHGFAYMTPGGLAPGGQECDRQPVPPALPYCAVIAPSATSTVPVTNDDSSEARKSAQLAISTGSPGRPIGWNESIVS